MQPTTYKTGSKSVGLAFGLAMLATPALADVIVVGQEFELASAPVCITLQAAEDVARYASFNQGDAATAFRRKTREGTCDMINSAGVRSATITRIIAEFPDIESRRTGWSYVVEMHLVSNTGKQATVYALFVSEAITTGVPA